MKRAVIAVALTVCSAFAAEPFYALLVKYSRAYRDFDRDIRMVADSVRTRPSVEFNHERFYAALDVTGRIIAAAVPESDLPTKSVSTGRLFLDDDKFRAALGDLDDLSQDLCDLAGQLWSPAGLVVSSQPETPIHDYTSLASYGRWNSVQLELKDVEIQKGIEDFDIRYGSKSDRINLLELVLVNHVWPFRGSSRGPSHWEPILRLTPVCYSVSDNRFIKTAQAGVNYYFMSDAPGFLRWVHHVGLAGTLADVTGDRVYKIGALGWGGTLHLGRYQAGAVYVPSGSKLNVFSTIDFQIIPTLF